MSEILKPTGRLFLIVGNSGSGKDSLLAEVLTRWPISEKPIRIPQRYITRPAHDSEQYISVTTREFGDLNRLREPFLVLSRKWRHIILKK